MIAFAVCVPVIEEIAFRGFLLDWMKRRMVLILAVLLTSAVFGLFHGPAAAIPTGFIGLIAGWMKVKTGNLWLPIFLHSLNNGIAITSLSLWGE